MSEPLHFSRLTLRRDAEDIAPLLQVLQPSKSSDRLAVDHRLLWTVIPTEIRTEVEQSRTAGTPKSAFLWRADRQRGRYYLLGPKPLEESQLFESALSPGERLVFDLRLNATVDRKVGVDSQGKALRQRCDVAMDLLKAEAKIDRAGSRMQLAEKAAYDWLTTRAAEHGFHLDKLRLEGYRAERFARWGGKFGTLGVFDLKGALTITEPNSFLARLRQGFGRGKAFGCGLMLIRRIA
ncbi:MAG: type I-E CRISPR-associated protein Cas6/Cse3/CasE [Candidatus Latescibacteria bacterium]|nr:type I-E CRISPR-associated protein Cas6/Cse3/CasE [Candidatus Latescibacterota bacterium]